jgi:hypothetical protein
MPVDDIGNGGLLAAPAAAQGPPAEIGQRNLPMPCWMQQPMIAAG